MRHHWYRHKRRAEPDYGTGEPAKSPRIRFLDNFVLSVGVVAPLTNVPQIYELVSAKDASGVSVLTWTLYAALSILWIVYGAAHKDRAIFWSSVIWLMTEVSVVGLAFAY